MPVRVGGLRPLGRAGAADASRLGAMGAPMAACLARAGHEVTGDDAIRGRPPIGATGLTRPLPPVLGASLRRA